MGLQQYLCIDPPPKSFSSIWNKHSGKKVFEESWALSGKSSRKEVMNFLDGKTVQTWKQLYDQDKNGFKICSELNAREWLKKSCTFSGDNRIHNAAVAGCQYILNDVVPFLKRHANNEEFSKIECMRNKLICYWEDYSLPLKGLAEWEEAAKKLNIKLC